jgi:hypothetical protein
LLVGKLFGDVMDSWRYKCYPKEAISICSEIDESFSGDADIGVDNFLKTAIVLLFLYIGSVGWFVMADVMLGTKISVFSWYILAGIVVVICFFISILIFLIRTLHKWYIYRPKIDVSDKK